MNDKNIERFGGDELYIPTEEDKKKLEDERLRKQGFNPKQRRAILTKYEIRE